MGRHKKNKNPDMYITTSCDNCKKEITEYKHAYKQSVMHFCSLDCYYKYRNRVKFANTRITTNCHGCKKEITVYRYLYNFSKTKNFFCTRQCYDNNRDKVVNRKSVYLTHYRCRSCCHYIPHENAIRRYISKYGEPLKFPYLICPNPDCKHIKLTTSPRHTRRNEIYRKQVRELQIKKQQQKEKEKKEEQIPTIDTTTLQR